MSKTLTEYITALGDFEWKPGEPALLTLAKVIWNKALDGDRAAIALLWERLEGRVPLGEVVPQPKEPLSDELEHAIDTIYKGSEDGGQSEGTDT